MVGMWTLYAAPPIDFKAFSVSCFTAGTAIYLLAQFVTITVSLTVLCLVLGAGVFGRAVAMWISSELIRTPPVLHHVVKNGVEATNHIYHILAIDRLTVEVIRP